MKCNYPVQTSLFNPHLRFSCNVKNKYVGPFYWAEMYAGRVTCCSLLNDNEYAHWRQTDIRTDGLQTV